MKDFGKISEIFRKMSFNQQKSDFYRFGEFALYPVERLLLKKNQPISTTPKVFDLLLFLVENQGRLLTKNEILDKVWADSVVEESTLARTVSMLRKTLGSDPNEFVETVPKKGYRFITEAVLITSSNNSEIEKIPLPEISVLENQPPLGNKSAKNDRRWAIGLLAVFLLAMLAIWAWQFRGNSNASPNEKKSPNEPKRLTSVPLNERFIGWTQDGRIIFDRGESNEFFFINDDGTGETKAVEAIPILKNGWLAPDQTRAVFQKSDKAYYLANADGSNEIKLDFSPENMAWSNDGKRIVFQGNLANSPKPGNPEIYIYHVETRKVTQITKNTYFDGDPTFSPDGKEIVFASDRDQNLEIYLMNDDGSNVRRLTDNPAHDSFPKFAPDGTQITFNSNRGSENTDVYLMNKDGKNAVRLTDWKSNEISRGGLSPDGTKLAFNSNYTGTYQIYVQNIEPFAPKLVLAAEDDLQTPSYSPNGQEVVYSVKFADKTGELRILNLSDQQSRLLLKTSSGNNYPRWSPDGNWIAFHQEVGGKWDIFKVRKDGTDLTKLTDHPASDSLPNWFPDGTGLIFRTTRNGDASLSEIYRMNAEGSEQIPLKIEKGYLGWSAISPDGASLVYSCNRQQLRGGILNLCTASADGSNERILLERSGDNVHSAFSADGKRLVFVANSDGNSEIYTMNADGTNPLRLTRNPAADSNPAFSPDGKRIIFSSNRNGKFALYSIEIAEN